MPSDYKNRLRKQEALAGAETICLCFVDELEDKTYLCACGKYRGRSSK